MRLLGLVTLVIVAVTSSASARPPSICIQGDACDLNALDAELTSMLAERPVDDSRVTVITSSTGQTLSAEVLLVDAEERAHGPRIVTASTCEDLLDSIALVIVMALPEAASTEPAVEARSAEPVEPPASTRIESLAITRSAPAGATRTVSFDGFVGGASSVTSRGVNGQLVLGARVRRSGASVSLQVRFDAPEAVPVTASGKITVTHADVSLAPCAHVRSLAGCALVSVGLLHGSGEALHSARDAILPVIATGLRIGWEHFVSEDVAVRVHVDGRAFLTTTTFDVDYMPVWQSSRLEGSAGVGLLARFL